MTEPRRGAPSSLSAGARTRPRALRPAHLYQVDHAASSGSVHPLRAVIHSPMPIPPDCCRSLRWCHAWCQLQPRTLTNARSPGAGATRPVSRINRRGPRPQHGGVVTPWVPSVCVGQSRTARDGPEDDQPPHPPQRSSAAEPCSPHPRCHVTPRPRRTDKKSEDMEPAKAA
jgi:hypothetical protein